VPNPTDLISLSPAQFAAVIALFLPGFVSLRVDRLLHPRRGNGAADDVLDIFGYSLLNAGLLSWAGLLAAQRLTAAEPDYVVLGLLAVLICVVGPALWPILFRLCQKWAAKQGWIMSPHRTAWDDFFSKKHPCWVVLHLSDGSLVGGYFGDQSVASVGAEAGHIYLEELWQLDAQGVFKNAVPESKGAIFRPSDYLWLEVRKDD